MKPALTRLFLQGTGLETSPLVILQAGILSVSRVRALLKPYTGAEEAFLLQKLHIIDSDDVGSVIIEYY